MLFANYIVDLTTMLAVSSTKGRLELNHRRTSHETAYTAASTIIS